MAVTFKMFPILANLSRASSWSATSIGSKA